MKQATKNLYKANDDIIGLMKLLNDISWFKIREQSIQRIIYLTKVIYSFLSNEKTNIFQNYSFSVTISGPYSSLITKSIIDLKVKELLSEDSEGKLMLNKNTDYLIFEESEKNNWIKIIIHILGLYGEDKIFSFTINDPLYKEALDTNSQKELNTFAENKTILVLNQFKTAFEETLDDVSNIDRIEYLELYFEYVFSKIISKKF